MPGDMDEWDMFSPEMLTPPPSDPPTGSQSYAAMGASQSRVYPSMERSVSPSPLPNARAQRKGKGVASRALTDWNEGVGPSNASHYPDEHSRVSRKLDFTSSGPASPEHTHAVSLDSPSTVDALCELSSHADMFNPRVARIVRDLPNIFDQRYGNGGTVAPHASLREDYMTLREEHLNLKAEYTETLEQLQRSERKQNAAEKSAAAKAKRIDCLNREVAALKEMVQNLQKQDH